MFISLLKKIYIILLLIGGVFSSTSFGSNLSEEWINSVNHGDEKTAIETAFKITGEVQKPSEIPEIVAKLCLDNGIKPEYIAAGFNHWDFEYWKRICYLKELSEKLTQHTNSDYERINALFYAVSKRIKHVDLKKNPERLWPDAVWKNAEGMCDSESWLLAELAYQAGFETMIIYLKNPDTNDSPHTVCEIRKGNNVWICDSFAGSIMPDTSLGDLVSDKNKLTKFWTEQTLWKKSAAKAEFWLPAYVQDYCLRNQILTKKIKDGINSKTPRFGENPFKRFFNYILLVKNRKTDEVSLGNKENAAQASLLDEDKHINKDTKFSYGLWFFPFRVLGVELNTMQKK